MRYHQEEFGAQDDPGDFAVPREAREKPVRYKRPSTRIVEHFNDCWLVSRQRRLNLALPWTEKKIVLTHANLLLKDHSEEEIIAMIDKFFSWGVDLGQLPLKQNNLWKDFWYNRDKLFKLVRTAAPVVDYQAKNARLLQGES